MALHNFARRCRTIISLQPTSTSFMKRKALLLSASFSSESPATFENNNNDNDFTRKGKEKNVSVAIVGAGPSGFYTAKYLNLAFQKHFLADDGKTINNINNSKLSIDLIEKLPTPFGLVRSGVAPDHPEVKNVQNDFSLLFQQQEKVVEKKGEKDKIDIRFWGNVNVGDPSASSSQEQKSDVSLEELLNMYDVVVLAYGCSSDRQLGLEGENELRGIMSARQFVSWYNGHPEFLHMGEELNDLFQSKKVKDVVVIGQGNVALDCARVIAKGSKGMYDTDIASHSLPFLQNDSNPLNISILGRRGHVQGAFTIKEIRELTKLKSEGHNTDFIVYQHELDLGETEATKEELKDPQSRPKVRIEKLLRSSSSNNIIEKTEEEEPTSNKVNLRFLMNPLKFIPNSDDTSRVGSVVFERTKLVGDPFQQRPTGTGEFEEVKADLVLISIGYKGLPIKGLHDDTTALSSESLLFDLSRGVVKNTHGKVLGLPNLYVSGWLKRGPSGIIATNIGDAKDTVNSIMKDLIAQIENIELDNNNIDQQDESYYVSARSKLGKLLHERKSEMSQNEDCDDTITSDNAVVDWSCYKNIDNFEMDPKNKRSEFQPREKIVSRQEMLTIANSSHIR